MAVITVASDKGGSGKTAVAAALGIGFSHRHRVILVDADPNADLTAWHGLTDGPKPEIITELNENKIIPAIQSAEERSDLVVVDTGGFKNLTASYAIGVSDLVLIPAQPAGNDIVHAKNTAVRVQNAAKIARREIPFRALLTRIKPISILRAHGRAELTNVHQIPVLDVEIHDLWSGRK